MFGHGKCPACQQQVTHCDLDKIVVGNQISGPSFHAVAACCPKCQTVLGVMVDPWALTIDIAAQTARKIQANPR
jgi:hypothetical protein